MHHQAGMWWSESLNYTQLFCIEEPNWKGTCKQPHCKTYGRLDGAIHHKSGKPALHDPVLQLEGQGKTAPGNESERTAHIMCWSLHHSRNSLTRLSKYTRDSHLGNRHLGATIRAQRQRDTVCQMPCLLLLSHRGTSDSGMYMVVEGLVYLAVETLKLEVWR